MYIPDDNFESYIENIGYGDGVMNDSVLFLVNQIEILEMDYQQIADMTGIEAFVSLTELSLEMNDFSTIDISNNINLVELDLDECYMLDSLNLNNPSLYELDIDHVGNLEYLNVNNCPNLAELSINYCYNLQALDLSNNSNLHELKGEWLENLTFLDLRNLNNTLINMINLYAQNLYVLV